MSHSLDASDARDGDHDVIIIGGSFCGSSLGILLRRRNPEARILILEKTSAFKRRVGESTSEVAGCFLTRVMGLSNYLAREHFQKHGLRMWFDSPDNEDPERCSEVGPLAQARLPTYQLDRSRLDEHLLDEAVRVGCEVVRDAAVRDVELRDEGQNSVRFHWQGREHVARTDWVADCSGRAALIGRERGTIEIAEDHPVHSMWVRFENTRNLDSAESHQRAPALRDSALAGRGAATNHLMGRGWWGWIIPLSNGEISAGITWDERLYTPSTEGPTGERVRRTLLEHPIGRLIFSDARAVENDARTLRNVAYRNNEVCGPGWIAVGDAAGFMDPLYSQGLDYCAHSVFHAHDLISRALVGEATEERIRDHDRQARESQERWFAALYKNKYEYLGDYDLMRAAFLLDIGAYFVGPVHLVYSRTQEEFAKMPYWGPVGAAFASFMALYNRRLGALARKRLARGSYGKNNLNRRHLVRHPFAPGLASLRPMVRGTLSWIRLELENAFVRPQRPHPGAIGIR